VAQLPPSIPEMVAQGQMPPGFRGTAGLSASNNNPGNLVYAGQPGAVPGQGHGASPFAKFPTMEAGWNALLNQVVLDQSRGHTLGSFINKYAPPSENDTASYITNMANRLGVSPNTPLANIPTADVAKGLAFFESSTKVGGLPTTPPALPTQPVQNASPQQSLITGRKLLEGFLRKEFGMEPDDAKVVSYGDHKLVTDKAGNPKFIIAGQGKMEMVDVTLPDGSTVRRPQLIPPSPLPGGIPVYNMAGQAVSNMAGPAGIMTKPPEVNWQTRTTPGGGKEQFPLPKAQAGMPSFQTEPPKGETSSEAGRIQLAQSGVIAFDQLNKLIFDPNTGKSNWGNLAASFGPGVPWTQGKQIKSLILKASDAVVRAATGAALNQQELRAYADMYAPSVFDNEQTVQSKMQGLQTFLNGYLEKMDPTGAQRLRVGNVQVTPPPMTMTPPKVNTNQPNYYYNPKTGKLEAGR